MDTRTSREAGFTIVEVLVAAVLLVIGALTTFGMLSAASRNTERAKASQIASDLAQQEIEALRSLSSEELALMQLPPHSPDSLNPDYRVNASTGTFAVERESVGSPHPKLVRNGGEIEGGEGAEVENGVVEPGPTHFVNGDVSGDVYRYIVWRDDTACGAKCPTHQDFKQIIVAVKLDTSGNQAGERGYFEVQSDFVDPTDSAENDPAPDSDGNVGGVTAQQFFLTDTPCAASGETERAEITGNHLLHNTLGSCASGLQTGTTEGAPDALMLGAPPDPAPEDPSIPALYDYSNDSYLEEPSPDTGKGLQLVKEESTGCAYERLAATNPQSREHRWVTDPVEADFTMKGKATLEFYTRTLNDELRTGTLCIYLFDRHETGSSPTDTLLANNSGGTKYWTYTPESNEYWPRFEWTKVRLEMNINSNEVPYTIPKGDRLGVALSVERANTSGEALAIMYDNPKYATRLEVDTSTPLEGG